MPITKPVIVEDPFAQLAWNTNKTIIALEKLANGLTIENEVRNIEEVKKFIESVIIACSNERKNPLTPNQDMMMSSLLACFCPLADSSKGTFAIPLSDLKKTKSNLQSILDNSLYEENKLTVLEYIQNTLLLLLRNANRRRPGPELPHYVEF